MLQEVLESILHSLSMVKVNLVILLTIKMLKILLVKLLLMVTKLLFTLGAHLVIPTNPERLMNIDKSNDLIENVACYRPTYFRTPVGHCNESRIALYESISFKINQWDTYTNE
ncbi:hypothetical protein H8356DRAFT_1684839 [Neocallimastix lanati (nom. inval.)]|nr:hypothetical protein H8356DRAFT_1684839 [Neocallimastix sp. JGI-2020a]